MTSQLKRKRNRVPLSCTICRKRKVKCDKTRPHCQQCSKTGVAHLCHYMEQTWAEEAEKELSKDSELKQLRERIKALEETLSKMHSASSNTPESASVALEEPRAMQESKVFQEPKPLQGNKYDNDELDLTRQFDMLHLKNNGTVHLGATHWLAIMKGDPYLKLLWSHIFTMREKMSEWVLHNKRKGHGSMNSTKMVGKCPVIHQPTASRCPVTNIAASASKLHTAEATKCPVDHHALLSRQSHDKPVDPRPSSNGSSVSEHNDGSAGPVCPVAHRSSGSPSNSLSLNSITNSGGADVCPVTHNTSQSIQHDDISGTEPHTRPAPLLPSFDKLASKCPVMHDTSPPPPGGLGSNPVNITQDQAIAELCKLLPPKRIIALILDKFFKHIYPVIPILDEQSFKHQIAQIVQSKDDSTTLRLTKPSDCCSIGILVIILRLTWLSLPQNACEVDLGPQCSAFFVPRVTTSTVAQSREELLLLNFETPAEAIHLARKFLIRFDEITSFSNSNVNLTTVQFAIFYKLYLMCCTEKTTDTQLNTFTSTSQDNEAHQMLLSSIVQMAFSCGLHRDPDNFPQLTVNTKGKLNKEAISNSERLKHTWRKTWYAIVSLDVQQSISLGSPRLLRNLRDFSDTKLPCTSKIDYVRDIKELIVVKNYTLFFQIDNCIVAVLNHILNVSMAKTVRKFELDSLIDILKNLCFGDGNVNEAINKLINKGLLFTTEGSNDQTFDEFYPLPSLEEILSPPPPSENEKDKKLNLPHELTTRALFFSKHIMLRMLLYLLNYILFTYYEPKGEIDAETRPLAKEYAQEALNYAMDGFRNCLLFFSNSRAAEGGNGSIFNHMEVVLAPCCLDIGHRALQFMVCLILRARCGPLTGMNESPILTSGNNTSSEDEGESKASENRSRESVDEFSDVTKDISLDVGEELAEILIARMTLFHKLTKQISVKYYYAKRMMKSTGFFITLLRNPSGKAQNGDKSSSSGVRGLSKFQHPSIAKMTGFFKNVPSLVLSANGDQIKRCPVYQDAIGFLPSSNSGSAVQKGQAEAPVQLPPFRAYQPITYLSNDLRRTSDVRNADTKRRKVTPGASVAGSPSESTIKHEGWRVLSPPAPKLGTPVMSSNGGSPALKTEILPPLERLAAVASPVHNSRNNSILSVDPMNVNSPAALSEISSSVNYTPDFEDFLMQNSNFNGLMINPSSIVEAVGFDNYGSQGGSNTMGVTAEFLPIDNSEIDGLSEIPTNAGFPMWD